MLDSLSWRHYICKRIEKLRRANAARGLNLICPHKKELHPRRL